MQSLLDTLMLLLSISLATVAAIVAGCGKKKPKMMTDLPEGSAGTKTITNPPAAPPPSAVSGDQKEKTPSLAKPVAPSTNPADQSGKNISKKVTPPGAVEDDGGYENCKDMSPEDLKKALI